MLSAIESVVEKFNKDPSYLHTSKNSPNDILNPQKSVPTQKNIFQNYIEINTQKIYEKYEANILTINKKFNKILKTGTFIEISSYNTKNYLNIVRNSNSLLNFQQNACWRESPIISPESNKSISKKHCAFPLAPYNINTSIPTPSNTDLNTSSPVLKTINIDFILSGSAPKNHPLNLTYQIHESNNLCKLSMVTNQLHIKLINIQQTQLHLPILTY